jgi:fatty-acyl-CoA synthase
LTDKRFGVILTVRTVKHRTSIVYLSDNIGSWPVIRAGVDAARIAVVAGEERLTYADLDARSARVSGALAAAGVGLGDRVAVMLKNRSEFLEVLFGAARLGAIFVPMNFRLSRDEVAYLLGDCEPRVVVFQSDVVEEVQGGAEQAGFGGLLLCVDGADPTYPCWRDAGAQRAPVLVEPAAPAMIMYTSGTTGPSKGAVITHENVRTTAANIADDWGVRHDDVTLVVNPIFHVVLHVLCMPLLRLGGTVILMENFDPSHALALIVEEKVSVMFAVPTAWQAIVDQPDFERVDLSAMRFASGGGAAVPVPLMKRFADRGIPFRQGFGLTETTSGATTMRPADDAGHRGSIGRPFFAVEARVVGSDGETVGPAESGELVLRGRSVCAGYWNKPQETAQAFGDDGWFYTGDIAKQDDAGFLYILDRKKDVIISGGENIASIEIEQTLLSHPAVRESAVIGVPHQRWGETPCAIVTVRGQVDETELIGHCRSRIAHYKAPTSVVIVDELPKTATGKIDKPRLRERYGARTVAEMAGLDAATKSAGPATS